MAIQRNYLCVHYVHKSIQKIVYTPRSRVSSLPAGHRYVY